MPDLRTGLHLNMLQRWKRRAADKVSNKGGPKAANTPIYGLNWGDPERDQVLQYVRDHFLRPYISPQAVIAEIGPGGGRWTRYMLEAKKIYAVDYHQELLDELRSNFDRPNIEYIRNSGTDFPGVPNNAVDLIFTFGTFVHLELDVIKSYLVNMKRLLKPFATAVVHYSDKTKEAARRNVTFSENDPEKMRALVRACGYELHEEDTQSLRHSSIVRFGLPGSH